MKKFHPCLDKYRISENRMYSNCDSLNTVLHHGPKITVERHLLLMGDENSDHPLIYENTTFPTNEKKDNVYSRAFIFGPVKNNRFFQVLMKTLEQINCGKQF